MSTQAVQIPPYCSWKTFRDVIDSFETALPKKVDRKHLGNYGVATQSHVLAALRFFDLIHRDGTPTMSLKSLVRSRLSDDGPDPWEVFAAAFVHGYSSILDGNNIATATRNQIRTAFERSGLAGKSTLDRAVRFCVKAAQGAGMAVSDDLIRGKRVPRIGRFVQLSTKLARLLDGLTTKTFSQGSLEMEAGAKASANIDAVVTRARDRNDYLEFPMQFPGKPPGRIVVPRDLDENDFEIVELTVQLIRRYVKGKMSRQAGTGCSSRAVDESDEVSGAGGGRRPTT